MDDEWVQCEEWEEGDGGEEEQGEDESVDTSLLSPAPVPVVTASAEGNQENQGEQKDQGEEGFDEKSSFRLPVAVALAVPAVMAPGEDERSTMTNRLVQNLRGVISDPFEAAHSRHLARTSLSRGEDNQHLTWHEVLGQGAYGRVTLVSHFLGPFAVKELMEVSMCNGRLKMG